jgi:putative resolvase
MNGARSKARRLLAGPGVQTVVAGHRDRFGRMNTELAGADLSAPGRRLAVLDPDGVDDGLVRDVAEVLTSFCARRYGRRPARNRAEKALRCAARDAGPASAQVAP